MCGANSQLLLVILFISFILKIFRFPNFRTLHCYLSFLPLPNYSLSFFFFLSKYSPIALFVSFFPHLHSFLQDCSVYFYLSIQSLSCPFSFGHFPLCSISGYHINHDRCKFRIISYSIHIIHS